MLDGKIKKRRQGFGRRELPAPFGSATATPAAARRGGWSRETPFDS